MLDMTGFGYKRSSETGVKWGQVLNRELPSAPNHPAQPLRIEFPSALYYVTARGNAREASANSRFMT